MRKVGGWWSGLQQISPDDFHFLRTNYSPSPGARSFVSAAFANKSRNGCAATKSRPSFLPSCETSRTAIGWLLHRENRPTIPPPSLFLEYHIGVFRDFYRRERGESVFPFSKILPSCFLHRGGRKEAGMVGLLWRIISLLFTCFEDRENNIWGYNKLFEVCYTGRIFYPVFSQIFLFLGVFSSRNDEDPWELEILRFCCVSNTLFSSCSFKINIEDIKISNQFLNFNFCVYDRKNIIVQF